jgi:HEAT repeat protein
MVTALRSGADPRARVHAARILGDLGGNDAVPALIAALSDPSAAVRSRAARSLAAVAPQDAAARESLRKRLGVETEELPQVDLAWCLARTGDRAHVDTLRRLLERGATEHVRAEAAMALGDVGDASDVDRLERAMEGDEMGRVRREAYVAIQKLKRG